MSFNKSVLTDLGREITRVTLPVSICMGVTVFLVSVLNPEALSNPSAVSIASVYYDEQEDDSTVDKLEGSLMNALIFVAIVGAMTFGLVLMMKYGCSNFLYGYMAFSGFTTFFGIVGAILLELFQKARFHMDVLSFVFLLVNFSVVGALTMFSLPAPLMLKQFYLVVISCAVAYIFTFIPAWTTWTLLVLMAVYDIVAVLAPGGPLKMLVELAQERGEDIPALVYESRRNEPAPQRNLSSQPEASASREENVTHVESSGSIHQSRPIASVGISRQTHRDDIFDSDPLDGGDHSSRSGILLEGFPEGIKLGLGDFIFYSVLVGRAAMYDTLTMVACFLSILAGLGCTLIWLALSHKALPALPVSITLASCIYFASRYMLEPIILPMSIGMLYF